MYIKQMTAAPIRCNGRNNGVSLLMSNIPNIASGAGIILKEYGMTQRHAVRILNRRSDMKCSYRRECRIQMYLSVAIDTK